MRPLLVAYELNPWLAVINSDSPAFVLYEGGRVIYLARENRVAEYRTAVLSPAALDSYLQSLHLDRLDGLAERTDISRCSDQPTSVITRFDEGRPRVVSVYGILRIANESDRYLADSCNSASAPPEFREIFRRLALFRARKSEPWRPDVAEVMFWPFEHASETLAWPDHWPDLSSAVKPEREGGVQRLFVRGEDLKMVREFLSRRGSFTAVLINGRKMSAGLRFVVPGEELWKSALPRAH